MFSHLAFHICPQLLCQTGIFISTELIKNVCFSLLSRQYWATFPTANLLGFNLWGRGLVTQKCHAPKNRSSLGTLLEPFAVGLQSWNNLQALLLQGKKPNKTCQKFTCEIICMLLHEHLRHLSTSVLTRTLSFSENHNFRTPVLQLYLLDLCFTTVAWLSGSLLVSLYTCFYARSWSLFPQVFKLAFSIFWKSYLRTPLDLFSNYTYLICVQKCLSCHTQYVKLTTRNNA